MSETRKYTVRIVDLAYGGEGVARPSDRPVIFVAGALPGEEVRIRPYQRKKNYWRAELVDILEASPHRVDPPCPVYENCGGCQLQHLEYPYQLEGKEGMIEDALTRIGGLETVPEFEVRGMEFPWYYRNKGQFPLGIREGEEGDELIWPGFYRKGSHELVFFEECMIQHQPINRLLNETALRLNDHPVKPYDEDNHRGNLRHLVLRGSLCTSQLQLAFVTRKRELSGLDQIAAGLQENIQGLWSVYHNINPEKTNVILGEESHLLAGEKFITEYIGQKRYLIHPDSFFQVNTEQAHKLFEIISGFVGRYRPERIIDAYCGAGTIAIYLSDSAESIVGIEEVPQAVLAASKNARLNDCQNEVEFVQGRVEDVLPAMSLEDSLLVVDPPRKGLDEECMESLVQGGPEAIIYVSCQPNTLARDISRLEDDYMLVDLEAVDMFPQTYHVETAALLEKRN